MGLPTEEYGYTHRRIWVYPLKNMGLPPAEYGSAPEEYGSIHPRIWVYPLKNLGLPLKNMGLRLKNMGLPMKNLTKIKDPPLKSIIVLLPYPRRNPQFLHLIILLKNFISPQTGGTDVKCNSPYCML